MQTKDNHNDADHLFKKRHSLAHLLAIAVQEFDSSAKLAIGPVIDNGFYYDFEFSEGKSPSSDDLKTLEKRVRHLIKQSLPFTCVEISNTEALSMFKDQPYKVELINDLAKEDKKLTTYKTTYEGKEFIDLCAGPHVENTKEIDPDSFTISHLAGAYWKGDEKNKMLTRIYGLAFNSKADLDEYIAKQEEAKKRDHRKLGKELDLFVFSDVVGKGLPLWTEKGATIRRELERFITDEEIKRDYKHVYTPDIAKIDLYKKSGHYPYYKESMYSPIVIDEEEFMLRPMTCPHHFELYLSKPRSYKELPMRIAEMAKLYRYEQSGELSGLVRVRSFCLADAHIICKDSEQAGQEIEKALDLIEYVTKVFGIHVGVDYSYRLSLGDRSDESKYFKDDASWDTAEEELRSVLKKRKAPFTEAAGEAAFYGPKIDIQMKDVNGKENTAFTVQYDFVMPGRFDLVYKDSDGKDKQALVVHRSSIGAIERIIAFLIEKYAGAFPTWLSPKQVAVLPINDVHFEYAAEISKALKDAGIRVHLDESKESLGKKIRAAKLEKIPYILVIGDKEVEAKTVTVEGRSGNLGAMSASDFTSHIKKEIETKSI